MNEEQTFQVFIPALVALLVRAEKLAERPLTKEEVLKIRDDATVVEQQLSSMPAFLKERGYHDLYAPEAWEEWQMYREGKLDLNVE